MVSNNSYKMTFAAWGFLCLFPLPALAIQPQPSSSQCRCLPEDECWPSHEAWSELNSTIGGRLIATVPLASVCHNPNFNAEECAILREGWAFPQTHFVNPSSFMAPYWQNQSCDPFTPVSSPCRLGNYADYSVNVSSAADAAAGLLFAQENNIRLVVKNTGHDYLGKSSGRGGLEIWTHNLKSIEFLNFSSEEYNGPAIKMGAGIQAFEIYEAAAAEGLRVVGGECSTVGIAGGYTQGGGHSALTSTYGMGADQTLEWEVVTANGQLLIASPTQNTDLYFALSGGGGGTYGVVISLTVKAHQDGVVAGASLTFNTTGVSVDTFWEAVEQFQTTLPAIVDTGATLFYRLSNTTFGISPITLPGGSEADIAAMLQPILSTLEKLNIPSTHNITLFPTYLEHFNAYFGPLPFGASFNLINASSASRLIPRSVVKDPISNSAFTAASRLIVNLGDEDIAVGALAMSASHSVAGNTPLTNAVLPAWRDALVHFILLAPWDLTAPLAENHAVDDSLVNVVVPALEAVAPDSGAYLNEDIFQQTDFQKNFYGSNYETLRGIKKAHDPNDLFYAITAVGSEAWTVGSDGRLCRTGS